MNRFTVDSEAAAPLGLGADFRRTGTAPWPVGPSAETVFSTIAQIDPAPLRAAAQGWGAILQQLPFDSAAAPRGPIELPAQAGWVRPTGTALGQDAAIEREVGVSGAHLVQLSDLDPILRAIAQWAGQAKDGAMDLRATLAAFGWFVVSLVLDVLKQKAQALPREEAQRLLGPFAPALVLLIQAQSDAEARRLLLSGKRADARAEAEAAALQARRAEVLRAYHAGEPVSRADLLNLAQAPESWDDEEESAAPAPPALGRAAPRAAAKERRKKRR